MGASYDVAIAGAGIVGAACAMECAAAGLKVVVVEPGPIGGGATAAGMGHVVAMDDSPAQLALTVYSRQLWIDLIPELPADSEYLACGTFWVAANEEKMDEVRRKHEIAQSGPIPYCTEVLDDSTVYPPCAARYFLEKSRAVLVRQPVTAISGLGLTLADGAVLSAGITVNATGSWAPELTPGIEVRKRKGHLVITDRYPGFVRHVLVELGYLKSAHAIATDSCAFNAQPRRNGQILLGSCRQYDETRATDSAMLARMLRRSLDTAVQLGATTTIVRP